MANPKRERHRESRRQAAEAAADAAQARRTRRMQLTFAVLGAVVLIVIVLAVVLGGGDDDDEVATPTTTTAGEPAATAPPATAPDAGGATAPVDENGIPLCPPEEGVAEPVRSFPAPPPDCIDAGTIYTATMSTNEGEMVMEIDPAADFVSANNFVFLSRYGYYDGSTFHRIIEEFVIQGGDPVGDPPGTGGPGYTQTGGFPPDPEGSGECLDLTTGEISDDASCVYELGDVAMANRGDPSSNGAQFFIITGNQGRALPALYSPVGRIVEGLELAIELQSVETGAGDRPLEDIVIESVVVTAAG